VVRPQFGKPQPRLISGRELCYVAIKPCGCVVVAIIPATSAIGSGPDVSEFSGVVQRWGLWTPPLRGFGIAVESAQLEIFVPMAQFEDGEEDENPKDQADEERKRIKRGGR